mmetsp:Transcript_3289/g.4793  ORF Transcript_3289/g.4793 Transcript_3289/m.4793 type:complete len:94 (+) Transcript_3289:882-1163(+)
MTASAVHTQLSLSFSSSSSSSSVVIAASTNQSLFTPNSSDIHAEVAALGQACQNGKMTMGCTAYITMPPCKKCFMSLYASGITRIVSRKAFVG